MSAGSRIYRCAVYTRKSSEEGLEQDFNSLQAQREACEAYIASQKHEGWKLVPTAFDDGGISGGTMERPALKRLLAAIQSGQIDVIVVYKVDRLTRSLADFAKMVEVFDAHGVSFVAVTQQFNTTTSMGRLTLNVLLSFAQFEREVTGERIRDKIAASKKKGMWMGGFLPLGYRVEDRKLHIVETEAEQVRLIFRKYLELDSVADLEAFLKARAPIDPQDHSRHIRSGRGAIYHLLKNPIYLGEIRHKGNRYPGQHPPIIDSSLWDQVQAKLIAKAAKPRGVHRKTASSPLMGKLFDETGQRLTPSHANKHGRRYRYYVSTAVNKQGETKKGWRLPAVELERAVEQIAHSMITDQPMLAAALLAAGIPETELTEAIRAIGSCTGLLVYIERVSVSTDGIQVRIRIPYRSPIELETTSPMLMKRRGVEQRLVIPGKGNDRKPTVDRTLLKAISRSRIWWEKLASGESASLLELAKAENNNPRYIVRLLPLAFLAPDIVEAIAQGRQPLALTAESLTRRRDLPLAWTEQRRVLGFS